MSENKIAYKSPCPTFGEMDTAKSLYDEAVKLRLALGGIRSDKAAALIPAAIRRIKRRGAHIVNLIVDVNEFWLGDGSE